MISVISALSFFILVLFNGCLTLPIIDEQFSSSTFSLLNDDLTTEHAFNLRSVSDDETSVSSDIDKKGLKDEHMGFEMSTSVYNSQEEKMNQAIRTFDEFFSTESMIFTTESSLPDKRDYDDLSLSSSEPTTYTSESSFAGNGDYHDLLFTTIEPTTSLPEFERRSFTNDFENETDSDSETDKREIQVEFTTNDMLLFPSTTFSIAPQMYTTESSNSTSTEKYIGFLKYQNKNQEQEEEPEQSTKLTKTSKKVLITKPSNVQSDDQSGEDPTEPTAPTAVFDQEALKNISYLPNDFMVLEENNTFIVTDHPETFSSSTIKYKNEQQPLTQGSTLLLFLLAAFLLCACVMASTLAFVKNRYNLKRKSRITEMEAHLDEHYQHYPHPFMFQQHYEKQ